MAHKKIFSISQTAFPKGFREMRVLVNITRFDDRLYSGEDGQIKSTHYRNVTQASLGRLRIIQDMFGGETRFDFTDNNAHTFTIFDNVPETGQADHDQEPRQLYVLAMDSEPIKYARMTDDEYRIAEAEATIATDGYAGWYPATEDQLRSDIESGAIGSEGAPEIPEYARRDTELRD